MNSNNKVFDNIIRVFLILELVSIGWLCSGTRVQYVMIMVTIAVLPALFILFNKVFLKHNFTISKYEIYAYCISILFLIYILIQSINVRVVKFSAEGYSVYEPKEHLLFLPSCIYKPFSDFNNTTYFALYIGLICFGILCYFLLKNIRFAKIAMGCFVISTLLMGCFAAWQKFNYEIMYDRFFSVGDFYGTFFLKNAAGAFFSIGIIVALSFWFIPLKIRLQKFIYCSLTLFASALLTYVVYDTKSEGALLFCGAIWIVFFILLFFCLIRSLRYQKVIVISTLLLLLLLSIIACCLLRNSRESINTDIITSFNARISINKNNIEIFKNYPIYGIGTSCYDYNLNKIINKEKDYANVYKYIEIYDPHNSIFAYLIRHGLVGGLMIIQMFILWFVLFIKKKMFLRPENIFIFCGALTCMMYGLIDMHLSSIPSTMFAFVFLIVLSISNLREI